MNLEKLISTYLTYCRYQKKLSLKTIKAYATDLRQFQKYLQNNSYAINISKQSITEYITHIHKNHQPKTIKRKIASIKAFFNYMQYEEIIETNPFDKINVKFKEPFTLPRTIPINMLQKILSTAYNEATKTNASEYQINTVTRDIAVLELLFATGVRVSELCNLTDKDVDLTNRVIRISGKGSKERIVQIGNHEVLAALQKYYRKFSDHIIECGFFFVNKLHRGLSDQSVRLIIIKYTKKANIPNHITPHMFRHSFATLLLEEDVDIRYIQRLLGHSSITTTQIYTHVSSNKQKQILTTKHPRNKIVVNKG